MPQPLYRYLDTNGDGTGVKDSAVNHSGAAEYYYVAPPAGYCYVLHRILGFLGDASNPSADEYGNLGSALTNGIIPELKSKGTVTDCSDGLPVKTNANWSRQCYDVELDRFGAGNDFLKFRWTFSKSGKPFYLYGDDGDYFGMRVNDNLSGLVGQFFQVQGYILQDGVDYRSYV